MNKKDALEAANKRLAGFMVQVNNPFLVSRIDDRRRMPFATKQQMDGEAARLNAVITDIKSWKD